MDSEPFADEPERNPFQVVEAQHEPVSGAEAPDLFVQQGQQDRPPTGIQTLDGIRAVRPTARGCEVLACPVDLLERDLMAGAPETIDCRMRDRYTEPARERTPSVVPRETSPVIQESRNNFLSQVLTLGHVPAGLYGISLNQRKVLVSEILPCDPVSLGTGKGQKEIFVVYPVEQIRSTFRASFPGAKNPIDVRREILKSQVDGRVTTLASLKYPAQSLRHFRPPIEDNRNLFPARPLLTREMCDATTDSASQAPMRQSGWPVPGIHRISRPDPVL